MKWPIAVPFGDGTLIPVEWIVSMSIPQSNLRRSRGLIVNVSLEFIFIASCNNYVVDLAQFVSDRRVPRAAE
jgi:hypothetical protein